MKEDFINDVIDLMSKDWERPIAENMVKDSIFYVTIQNDPEFVMQYTPEYWKKVITREKFREYFNQ